jgi:hypothetical protein
MRARYVFLPALAVVGLSVAAPASDTPPSPRPRPSPAVATPTPPPILEGIVRGPDGKPIEKALVIARSLVHLDAPPLSTRTDARGRFRLDRTSRGKHRVRAEAAGLAGRTIADVVPGAPLTIDLARGGRIEGVVRDGATGHPAAGIRVETRDGDAIGVVEDPDAGRIEATTDAEGRFALTGLGPGRHALTARARGRGFASRSGVALGASLEMTLEPASTLFGVVSGPDGKPVAGAIVTTLAMRSTQAPRPERSDAWGRYELNGLAAGLYDVAVRAPGLAPGAVSNVALDGRDDVRVDVALQPGARVTGRLVGANDKPLAGEVSIGELGGQPAPYVLADLLRAASGADGRFAIDAVPIGTHALGATAPGLGAKRVEVEVSATQRAVDVGDVRMEAGLVIRGRVRTAAGEPIASADVQANSTHSPLGRSARAQTDDDGAFAVGGLGPVTYNLSATAPGFGTTRFRAEPGADPIDLVLEPAGRIVGRVQDERGQPIESFNVVARAVAEGQAGAFEPFQVEDGRFTLENVLPGDYAVTVRAPERASATVSAKVAATTPADIGTVKLGPGSTIRGTVVDAAGGPVGGARIAITASARPSFTTTFENEPEVVSDGSGAFEVKGVEAGSYEVTASHARYARSLPAAAVVAAGQPAPEVRLVLSEGGRVEGTYRRRDGAPVPASFVMAMPIRDEPWRLGQLVPVQPDGSFVVEHVPAGRVRVSTMTSAGQGQYRTAHSRETVLREGETARVDIVNREVLLTGRVTRAGGSAAGLRLQAHALDSGGSTTFGARGQSVPSAPGGLERMGAVTREDGAFEMIIDDPGQISVTAWSPDSRVQLPGRMIDVPDTDTHAVELSFDGVPVTGIVVDADTDAPVPYAFVMAESASATAGSDGRFQLELPPGEHHFTAVAEDQGYAHGGMTATVGPSGAVDIRVALPRGMRIVGRALDPSGRPVHAARVSAKANGANSSGLGETRADGSFEIRGLKNADYRVTAWSDAGYFAIRASVGAGTTNLELRMQPAARIAVQVVTAEGQPLAGARPSVGSVDGASGMWELGLCRAPTDAQGRTELLAPAGRITITAGMGTLGGYTATEVAPGEVTSARIVVQPFAVHPKTTESQ